MNPARRDLERLRSYDSGTVVNALDHLGLRGLTAGFASAKLRYLIPELPASVGFAVTCREDTTTGLTGNGFDAVYEAIEQSEKPVVVACQDVGQDRWRSCHLGDVMAATMQALGAVAFVTDGGIRDVEGIRTNATGFSVLAAGCVPAAGAPAIVDVGTTVSIFGMSISPGDLVFVDANGACIVPTQALTDVLREAQRIKGYEHDLMQTIHAVDFSLDSLKAARVRLSGRAHHLGDERKGSS